MGIGSTPVNMGKSNETGGDVGDGAWKEMQKDNHSSQKRLSREGKSPGSQSQAPWICVEGDKLSGGRRLDRSGVSGGGKTKGGHV